MTIAKKDAPTEQITLFKEALADADAWTGDAPRPPVTQPSTR